MSTLCTSSSCQPCAHPNCNLVYILLPLFTSCQPFKQVGKLFYMLSPLWSNCQPRVQAQPKACAVNTLALCTHWLAKTDSIIIYFYIIRRNGKIVYSRKGNTWGLMQFSLQLLDMEIVFVPRAKRNLKSFLQLWFSSSISFFSETWKRKPSILIKSVFNELSELLWHLNAYKLRALSRF